MAVETRLKAQDLDIMMGLLAPQPKGPMPSRFAEGTGIHKTRLASVMRAARDHFERRGAAGDAVANAIVTICSEAWTDSFIASVADSSAREASRGEPTVASFSEEQEPSDGTTDCAAFVFYDLAAEEFRADNIGRAAALLATLLHGAMDEAEALSGLAVCAASLGLFDKALLLATECLKLPEKHPRAYCIAGFCELERGNRKAAQSHLALAARLARTRPEFRKDLQAAQRLLLILHFA